MSAPDPQNSERIATRTHRDLVVWRESMRLLTEVYRVVPDLQPPSGTVCHRNCGVLPCPSPRTLRRGLVAELQGSYGISSQSPRDPSGSANASRGDDDAWIPLQGETRESNRYSGSSGIPTAPIWP